MKVSTSSLAAILRGNEAELLSAWMMAQRGAGQGKNLLADSEMQSQSREFLELLQQAITESKGTPDPKASAFKDLRRFLETTTASRTQLGLSPSETARFIFSLKSPLFAVIRKQGTDPAAQLEETSEASLLLDDLGLQVMEAHQKARESVILRQQQEMLELSTPVVKLWDGVLALPIIGTLDSSRTQTIMESLLERIVATGSELAIIDITGVPTVDTLTAQHLLKTFSYYCLMGADFIIF